MDLEVLEYSLRQFIEHVREDGPDHGRWILNEGRIAFGEPPLVVGLARFQSYRARTEAALVEELIDYIQAGNVGTLNFKVLPDGQVVIW